MNFHKINSNKLRLKKLLFIVYVYFSANNYHFPDEWIEWNFEFDETLLEALFALCSQLRAQGSELASTNQSALTVYIQCHGYKILINDLKFKREVNCQLIQDASFKFIRLRLYSGQHWYISFWQKGVMLLEKKI